MDRGIHRMAAIVYQSLRRFMFLTNLSQLCTQRMGFSKMKTKAALSVLYL
jgi:hypothetical protein